MRDALAYAVAALGTVWNWVSSAIGLVLVVVTFVAFVGGTTVFWVFALGVAIPALGLPVVTFGLAEAVGLPATVRGVPVVYAVGAGLVTTVALFAGGNGSGSRRRHADGPFDAHGHGDDGGFGGGFGGDGGAGGDGGGGGGGGGE